MGNSFGPTRPSAVDRPATLEHVVEVDVRGLLDHPGAGRGH